MWKKYKLHAEQNIYIVSKYPFHKTPVNYRRQMSEFTREKSGSHRLNKEIKMNIVSNETMKRVCLGGRTQPYSCNTPTKDI